MTTGTKLKYPAVHKGYVGNSNSNLKIHESVCINVETDMDNKYL